MVDDEDVKEKVTLTLVKGEKKSFIQNYCDQCQDYAVGEKDQLNSKHSKESWRFIANEQERGQWMEDY